MTGDRVKFRVRDLVPGVNCNGCPAMLLNTFAVAGPVLPGLQNVEQLGHINFKLCGVAVPVRQQ